MVGAISIGSSPFTDSHSCPRLCLDPISSSSLNIKNNGVGKKRQWKKPGSVDLSSSFLDAWYDWRSSTKTLSHIAYGCSRKQRRFWNHGIVVDELGGQYEETFNDVKKQILNYFTYKAVRTVLQQLYEMNPTQYTWFYNFIATNKPGNGKRFIQALGKEKQELAERVMVTRLHLYGKWIKICDHAQIYKEISDENLELMRERLMETIVWPSDDPDTN
ncbi:hypothetical protein F0562_018711 [Nyssa sinensis]|uniref:Chaperonin-like RbcX protein n=1 Tax=Nyssa sinensis TaxID=561372 RepID=A0A5J4ZDQ6_9ASTE|nr:hypothetical protein F0562_018711 [Nyssa sinensis]